MVLVIQDGCKLYCDQSEKCDVVHCTLDAQFKVFNYTDCVNAEGVYYSPAEYQAYLNHNSETYAKLIPYENCMMLCGYYGNCFSISCIDSYRSIEIHKKDYHCSGEIIRKGAESSGLPYYPVSYQVEMDTYDFQEEIVSAGDHNNDGEAEF